MWVFFKGGFVSIVKHRKRRNLFLVRSRVREDLDNFLSYVERKKPPRVYVNSGSDYRFRAFLKRSEVADVMFEIAEDIDYSNFKNAVHGEPDRDLAYMGCWRAMNHLQTSRHPRPLPYYQPLWDNDIPVDEDWPLREEMETPSDRVDRMFRFGR